jgi:hypothetical protein
MAGCLCFSHAHFSSPQYLIDPEAPPVDVRSSTVTVASQIVQFGGRPVQRLMHFTARSHGNSRKEREFSPIRIVEFCIAD